MYLEKIIGSKTKIRILYTLISNPDCLFFEKELAVKSSASISEVNRQIKDFIDFGLVLLERKKGKKYYIINKHHFLFSPLQNLFKYAEE